MYNKFNVNKSFSKVAEIYNQNAILQKIVAKKTADLITKDIKKEDLILDLGCGTGFLSDYILQKSEARAENITRLDISSAMLAQNKTGNKILADIEDVPFSENRFNVIASSLAFQWLNNPQKSIANYQKLLLPNGIFICSLISNNTFKELKEICKITNIDLSLNKFLSIKDFQMEARKFQLKISSEEIILQYDNIFSLLHSIKNIGAGNSFKNNNGNTLTKTDFQKLNETYCQKYGKINKISSTWEIITIISKPNESIS